MDLERALWIIPAARTREHIAPLSAPAIAILRELFARGDERSQRYSQGPDGKVGKVRWVLPSPNDIEKRIHSHAATTGILRMRARLAIAGVQAPFNTHDLHRTVATSLGELGVPDEILQRILNHAPRTVAARHYNHARNLHQVRQALEIWATTLLAAVENHAMPERPKIVAA